MIMPVKVDIDKLSQSVLEARQRLEESLVFVEDLMRISKYSGSMKTYNHFKNTKNNILLSIKIMEDAMKTAEEHNVNQKY